MAVVIANREVQTGDVLYLASYRAWGAVTGFDTNAALVHIVGSSGQTRTVHVTNGGMISGIRQAWWHAPLQLDLPFQNIGAYQRVLDALAAEGLGT